MKTLPFLTAASVLALCACSTSKRVNPAWNEQPPSSLVPVGIYYDSKRLSAISIIDTTADLFSNYQIRMLNNRNQEWRRPVIALPIDFIDKDGKRYTNESLSGTVVVLNFWSHICNPCIREIPWLCSLRDSFPEVNFIGVCLADEKTVRKIVEKHKFNWPQIVADSSHTCNWLIHDSYFPTTVIIDQNGFVRSFNVGGTKTDHKRISDSLRSVLKNGPRTSPLNYKDLHYIEEYTDFTYEKPLP